MFSSQADSAPVFGITPFRAIRLAVEMFPGVKPERKQLAIRQLDSPSLRAPIEGPVRYRPTSFVRSRPGEIMNNEFFRP